MSATICGHERELLISRLIAAQLRDEGFDVDGNATYRRKLLIERGHDAAKIEASAAKCATIDATILDPAKLADLLAEVDHVHEYVISGNTIERCEWGRSKRLVTLNIWTMTEARAALLRILELPQDATAEDAVKALTYAS